jgi:hypothetical protein
MEVVPELHNVRWKRVERIELFYEVHDFDFRKTTPSVVFAKFATLVAVGVLDKLDSSVLSCP